MEDKGYNYKTTIYYEKANPFLKLEWDTIQGNNEYHAEIHKISLATLNNELNKMYQEKIKKMISEDILPYSLISPFSNYQICLRVLPVDNKIATLIDITPYKEMTLQEIEKELGYKVKIKS